MTPWRITYGNTTFTDEDLTGADLVAVDGFVDDGWASINVTKSPLHSLSTTAVVVARLTGRQVDDVFAELRGLRIADLPVPEPRTVHQPEADAPER